MSIDEYQEINGTPREVFDLVILREERQAMLIEDWGISRIDIANAVRTTFKIKNQRRRSVNNLDNFQKLDMFFESAQRKLKRTLLFQKRTSSQLQDMMEQAAQASAFMKKIAEANVDGVPEDPSAEPSWGDRTEEKDYSGRALLNLCPSNAQMIANCA